MSRSRLDIADQGQGLVTLFLIAGVSGLVALIYSRSFSTMAELWQQSSHQHGLLVFPIAAYLLWRSRQGLKDIQPEPWAWGVGLLLVLVLAWLLSRAAGIQVGEHLAVLLMIPAAVTTFLGTRVANRALFPLLFLVVALPMGDALIPYLMRTTADVAAAMLRGVGVPVFREGQFLTLPGGDFEVADVCSGLRYLISGTIVALLFGHVTYRSNIKRAVFVAVSAATLVIANGVRAFLVMLVASATDMRYLAGRDHVYFGWLLFGLVIVGLFWVGARFADKNEARANEPSADVVATSQRTELTPLALVLALVMLAMTARPFEKDFGGYWVMLLPVAGVLLFWAFQRRSRGSGKTVPDSQIQMSPYRKTSAVAILVVTVVVLETGPLLATRPASAVMGTGNLTLFPVAECGAPIGWSLDWQPRIESPDFSVSGTYQCSAGPVSVFVAGYNKNVQGKELVNDRNRVFPENWHRFAATTTQSFAAGDGRTVEVNEVRVQDGERESLIWYWYGVGDRTAIWPTGVKLLQAYELVVRGRSDGRLYLLQTPLVAESEPGRVRLRAVARELGADNAEGHGEAVSRNTGP